MSTYAHRNEFITWCDDISKQDPSMSRGYVFGVYLRDALVAKGVPFKIASSYVVNLAHIKFDEDILLDQELLTIAIESFATYMAKDYHQMMIDLFSADDFVATARVAKAAFTN